MAQEEKDLLLRDLCARLPYGVKIHLDEKHIDEFPYNGTYMDFCIKLGINGSSANLLKNIEKYGVKPFLRPISSMTEEEEDSLAELNCYHDNKGLYFSCGHSQNDICDVINFLNSHHFDYRGLIEKGLAIEAPNNMYINIK